MSAIHYAREYGADGLVCRLVWSPAIQSAAEDRARAGREQAAEEQRRARLPMPAMREWLEQRRKGARP